MTARPAKKAGAKKAAPRKRTAKTTPAAASTEVPVVPGVTPLSQLNRRTGGDPMVPGDVDLHELEFGVDADLEPIATFTAYGPRLATNDNGEMTITMKADKQQKYNAMPITDHNDVTLFFKAFVVRRAGQA